MEFLSLLSGETTEEKIAGVILCDRYLRDHIPSSPSSSSSSSLPPDSFECLRTLLENVSEQFLIQMLQTKPQDEGISLGDVAISVLSFISQHPTLIIRFSPFCAQIFELTLSDNKLNPSLFDITLAICTNIETDFFPTMFKRTLQYVCSNSEDSSVAFTYLIEIALGLKSKLYLEPEQAQLLRNVIIQGLQRSSALTRDNFLIGLMVFLSRIDPQWTLERPNQHSDDKFIQLFVSLLCGGEFRLLLQELTTLTEESSLSQERIDKTANLLCVCYEIFDIIYDLLLGSTDSGETQSAPLWEALSATTLQIIQKEVTSSIEYYFKFLHHHSDSGSNVSCQGNRSVWVVVTRGIMIFIKWIQEDESLHSSFVSYYEALLNYSKIPVQDYLLNSRDSQMPQHTKDQILEMIFNIPGQNNESETPSKKYSGGVGCVLIIRNLLSGNELIPSPTEPELVVRREKYRLGLSVMTEMVLDPFLSTLNCVLIITDNETLFTEIEIGDKQMQSSKSIKKKKNSGQSTGQQMIHVATSSAPQLLAVLVASYNFLRQYFQSFSPSSSQAQNNEALRQCISLSSICSELLYLILISPTNQMMQSLRIQAISDDPTSGEYLKVSYGSWIELRREMNSLIERRIDPKRLFPKKRDDQGDYINFIEKLGSLEDIFREVFHN